MTDKRDEQEQEERPKIQVVDRRMLSDDERSGSAPQKSADEADSSSADSSSPPKLEIIGGGKADEDAAPDAEPDSEDAGENEPLSEADEAEMRAEVEKMEEEQFAALEEQIGRPLTEQEKQAVRDQMEQQARSAANLEIMPVLQQILGEMHARASVHLGLMPNPYTRLVARNDGEARLAIDAFSAIFEVIKPRMEPAIQGEFERVLNDLRVNYVNVTGNQPTNDPGSRIIH